MGVEELDIRVGGCTGVIIEVISENGYGSRVIKLTWHWLVIIVLTKSIILIELINTKGRAVKIILTKQR